MPTILDFQIKPALGESYTLDVIERGAAQPLATSTFHLRVDFLTDFSVDRLNAATLCRKRAAAPPRSASTSCGSNRKSVVS